VQAGRRGEILDDAEVATFIKFAKPEFRLLLEFLYNTGCRPGEARIIERRHVDMPNQEVRFKIGEDKTSAKTGRPRVIHLNDQAKKVIEGVIRRGVTGPLFRNSRGNPWTRHALASAMRRLRPRAGVDERAVCYALRHQYITDALARGVPIATVAEMTGTSPEMIAKVYSHLSDKKALLMAAANQVRPPQ
jgi:integrase